MTLPTEKIKRIQEMIREHKSHERYIEHDILLQQMRLDEHRKRRVILQDLLEGGME